ncbi:MAG: 2-C-methyl-D-erythritol 4-phosphate cytidylyltransferase [Deltaproteobacteria bacterium]|nr:2-C-methyl-D-erythritol 4-phosphate cytidylyltransferase [Deltaproteobacteria bacterium]
MPENPASEHTSLLRTVAVIPAAGTGLRMGTEQAKQFLDLDGRPLLAVTLDIFQSSPVIHEIVLVVPPQEVDHCRRRIVDRFELGKVRKVVAGGKRRQDSVRRGIEACGNGFEWVVIHDGVRPLVRPELIDRIVAAVRESRAVISALPAKETVKDVDNSHLVRGTYDRRRVWLVQTPQAFRYEDILAAHRLAAEEGWDEVTDDALLMERMGISVRVIEGMEDNIKVTTPHDLELARFLLKRR